MTLPSKGSAGSGGFLVLALVFLASAAPPTLRAQSYGQVLQEVLAGRPERPLYRVKQESDPAPADIEQVSEAKILFSGLIRLYQATLSANDMDVCNFWPSCSRFGAASLHDHGLVKGGLLTVDRLMRCHGLPGMARAYPYDAATEKYLDPVEQYADERLNRAD